LAVDLHDHPVRVEDHDRVWGRFEEAVEEPSRLRRDGFRPDS